MRSVLLIATMTARGLRPVGDGGDLLAHEGVHQRAFAHIGAADEGHEAGAMAFGRLVGDGFAVGCFGGRLIIWFVHYHKKVYPQIGQIRQILLKESAVTAIEYVFT